MTVHKVSELECALLDAAVAMALGWRVKGETLVGATTLDGRVTRDDDPVQGLVGRFQPSLMWQHGGPIIERELIHLEPTGIRELGDEWFAAVGEREDGPNAFGRTPLEAAMRAYVASKFGETVELP